MTWAPDYVTAEQLKSYLRIGDDADDVFIAWWITAVSRNVDDYTGRQFGQTEPETRRYRAEGRPLLGRYVVEIDDVMDTDDMIVVDGNGTAVDFELLPVNAGKRGRPYERLAVTGCGDIYVTNPFGWSEGSAGPTAAKVGVLLQAARLAARRDAPFGVAGSPSEGSEMRLLAQLDPDFRTTLKPFRRRWWAR